MRLWNSWDREYPNANVRQPRAGGIFSDDGDVYLRPKCRAFHSPTARPSLATASDSAIQKSSPFPFTSQYCPKEPRALDGKGHPLDREECTSRFNAPMMVHLCRQSSAAEAVLPINWSVTSSASTALSGSPLSTDSTETTSWSPLTVGLSGTTSRLRPQNAIKHENGCSFYLLLAIRGNDCFKGPSKRRQLLPRLFEVRHSSPSPPQTGRKWVENRAQVPAYPLTSHFSGVRGGTTTIPLEADLLLKRRAGRSDGST